METRLNVLETDLEFIGIAKHDDDFKIISDIFLPKENCKLDAKYVIYDLIKQAERWSKAYEPQ